MSDRIISTNATEKVIVGATSVASTANSVHHGVYRFMCDTDSHVAIGTTPVATSDEFVVPALKEQFFNVPIGQKLAVIQAVVSPAEWDYAVQEDDSSSSFKTYTNQLNSTNANDVLFFPAGAGVDDAFYFGLTTRFSAIGLDIGTAGTGTYTLAWEYWDGSSWTALAGLSDGTGAFKNAGATSVTFTTPTDWESTIVDGVNLYYVRAKRDAGTVTADPLGTQGLAASVVGTAWLSQVS